MDLIDIMICIVTLSLSIFILVISYGIWTII